MVYNFDEVVERRGTNSTKWDLGDNDVLPMWIADMDFKTAQPIIESIKRIAEQGIYGYSIIPESYNEAVCAWFNRIHGWNIEKDWLIYSTGVVPVLGMLVRSFTEPGDKVIIQSPVYQSFYKAISDNGREVVENPLKLQEGKYVMDYEDLEEKASEDKVKMLILCSPHNPVGRVWNREELVRLGEICVRHGVLVVSDEIHCDIIFKGYKHIPFASIDEALKMNSIICTAPSKTFNLAALKVSNIIVPNQTLREKVNRAVAASGLGRVNVFAVEATIAAYKYGEEWLQQLMDYLMENVNYIDEFIKRNLPMLKIIKPEGTYLVWVDCKELKINKKNLDKFFLREAKVRANIGHIFGNNGEGFIRINIACSRSILEEGLKRIQRAIDSLGL